MTCKNDETETFTKDEDYTVAITESNGTWTATVALTGDEKTVIGSDSYKPETGGGPATSVELPITIDFSDPTSYSWIATATVYEEDNATPSYKTVTGGGNILTALSLLSPEVMKP